MSTPHSRGGEAPQLNRSARSLPRPQPAGSGLKTCRSRPPNPISVLSTGAHRVCECGRWTPARAAPSMRALGHEGRFQRPRLSGRCRFGEATFVGTHGKGARRAVFRPSRPRPGMRKFDPLLPLRLIIPPAVGQDSRRPAAPRLASRSSRKKSGARRRRMDRPPRTQPCRRFA
jgi:hypothetical protein